MSKLRIAINGFGRIGRSAARIMLQRDDMELVAINDPSPTKLTAQLFEFDSSYGRFKDAITYNEAGDELMAGTKKIKKFSTRNIEDLPWADLKIDVVLECTGVFRTVEACQKHIDQGAKKVLLSAPAKSAGFKTVVLGVNDEMITAEDKFVSNASCTTNCLAPIVKVLNDTYGVEHGMMTTIHSYTNDQRILDVNHKSIRRSRAAAINIIPTTTGAAKAVGVVIPEVDGKLTGLSVRVPTATVSLVDLVVKLKGNPSAEEVNKTLKKASDANPTIIGFENRELVSSDYKGDSRSSIVDSLETAHSGEMIKILSWYDNEWGYASRLVDMAARMK
jgi:glyceraldehyde 3-phosphate dehydrogenase